MKQKQTKILFINHEGIEVEYWLEGYQETSGSVASAKDWSVIYRAFMSLNFVVEEYRRTHK